MLTALCYILALVLLVLAAVLPPSVPCRDRLAYAGLAFWIAPGAINAIHNH